MICNLSRGNQVVLDYLAYDEPKELFGELWIEPRLCR
jgi:hypothetical protein